jgi:hypothetical protein
MASVDFDKVFKDIKENIESLLGSHLRESASESKELIDRYIPQISEEAARYSVKAARGDPDAQSAMEHLMAQSKTLAALLAQKQQNRVSETLTMIVVTIAKILGEVLRAALV